MASGNLYAEFDALGGVPPASAYATLDMTAADVPVLEFDDGADESVYFRFRMPDGYDGSSGLTVVVGWKFATFVGSQTCAWKAAFYRVADDADSIESATFASDQASGAVTEASATGEISYDTIAFTNAQADGIQPNEWCILRIKRDAASGTASPGDAQLAFVAVKET